MKINKWVTTMTMTVKKWNICLRKLLIRCVTILAKNLEITAVSTVVLQWFLFSVISVNFIQDAFQRFLIFEEHRRNENHPPPPPDDPDLDPHPDYGPVFGTWANGFLWLVTNHNIPLEAADRLLKLTHWIFNKFNINLKGTIYILCRYWRVEGALLCFTLHLCTGCATLTVTCLFLCLQILNIIL